MTDLIAAYNNVERVISDYDAKATDWCTVNTAINDRGAALCEAIDRATYEAQCAQMGITPATDEHIRQCSYTLRHFDYPKDRVGWLTEGLARQRLNGIEAERKTATPKTAECVPCANCGQPTPRALLMNASLMQGVCPDCYDEVSD